MADFSRSVCARRGRILFPVAVDLHTYSAGFVASVGYDPDWPAAYCQHFSKLDYLTSAIAQLNVGEVKSNDQALSLSDLRLNKYYNDYQVPQDKVYAMGALLIKDNSQRCYLRHRGDRHKANNSALQNGLKLTLYLAAMPSV